MARGAIPWAVAFPEGLPPTTIPVHPTQLYETLALLPLAWVLVRWRRQRRRDRFVLGSYLIVAGAVRLLIEFLRTRESQFRPFAVAHVFALVAACAGRSCYSGTFPANQRVASISGVTS